MRALTYTLILSAVLVGFVILQFSTDEKQITSPKPRSLPVKVASKPALQKTFDLSGLDSATVDEIYQTGSLLLELWHVKEATRTFEIAAQRDSSHFFALAKLVECYSQPFICREDEARAAWRSARGLAAINHPQDTVFVDAMGDLFLSKEYQAAAAGFEQFVDEPDLKESAGYYLAKAYFHQGKLNLTEQCIEKLLDIDESNGRARELLIRCAAARSDLDEAETLAKDLAVLYSEESYPYVILSQVEMLRGDLEDAFAFCGNALSLDPKYIPAILCKGNLYAVNGESEAARATFEKLLLFDDPILTSLGSESVAFVDFLRGRFDEGSEMMDEAIRNAMLVGSVRRGLYYALRLVDYLCQLGQREKARDIIERWFSGFGEIPYQLAKLKLDIYEGNIESVLYMLRQIGDDQEWLSWMRWIGFEYHKARALAHIKNQQYQTALEILESSSSNTVADEEHSYLEGYAAFENGNAELAAKSFAKVLHYPRGLEFPFHHDPVLYVQALFYLAETSMATGDQENAITYYQTFIEFWGESSWEMQAVSRAKAKLHTLSSLSTTD
jgi:tetratricopeptide (TPR) repeat protein